MPPARSLFAFLGLLAILAAACGGRPREPKRPNVLFIVVDTLRADRTDFGGSGRGLTPFLERLSRQGTSFERAYANTSWTLPSVATLFTSRYQHEHGVVGFSSKLPDSERTLAEVLAEHGFASAGMSANFLLEPSRGFAQGFDYWLVGKLSPGGEPYASARKVREQALRWLDDPARPSEAPVLLYLHFMEPHGPYSPPEPFRSQRLPPGTTAEQVREAQAKTAEFKFDELSTEEVGILEALYDAEIASLDHELETLFAELGARGFLDGAVVIVAADHGEEFREHGILGHGFDLFEEVVRVPLFVSAPKLPGGRVVRERVALVDVAPTLLELLGLPAEAAFEGRSLVSLMQGGTGAPAPILLELAANTDVQPDLRKHALGIVRGDLKLLLGPGEETGALFELKGDPGERAPLDPAGSPRFRALREELQRAHAQLGGGGKRAEAPLSDEQRRQLRALGYLRE